MRARLYLACCLRRSERGFTLVELMISLIVLGFLTFLSVSFLRMAVLSQEKAKHYSDGIASVEAVQSALRSSFERMLAEATSSRDLADGIFHGDSDTVVFRSYLPLSFEERYPFMIRLSLEITKDMSKDLMLAWRSVEGEGPWRQVVLLHNVADMHFRYFGSTGEGGSRWGEAWIQSKQPPSLISLNLSFCKGDARIWPELIVAPAIDRDVTTGSLF